MFSWISRWRPLSIACAALGLTAGLTAAGTAGAAAATTASTATATAGDSSSCPVSITVRSSSSKSFTASVTVSNNTPWNINGWTVSWTWPSGQQISSAWNAVVTQSGSSVSAGNESYNDRIVPGGSASFGMQVSYTGTNTLPSVLALNGQPCGPGEPPPPSPGSAPPVPLSDVAVAVNIYNDAGLQATLADPGGLAPYIRPGDVFIIVSGNNSGSPDLSWIQSAASALHQAFPDNQIRVFTSGSSNVGYLVSNRAQIPSYVQYIGYDYEPNWPNEPEFSWDFTTTMQTFGSLASEAVQNGFKLFALPTGRPLEEGDLFQYNWDYGTMNTVVTDQVPQLQSDCHKGDFGQAVYDLEGEALLAGIPLSGYFPQVTVDATQTYNVNGVTPQQAAACAQDAANDGFSQISLWWAPSEVTQDQQFLQLLGR